MTVAIGTGVVGLQFTQLLRAHPKAVLEALSDGTTLVTVPDVPLPAGWSAKSTTVSFIVPIGYPAARPDCFYADADLRLAESRMPHATQMNTVPGRPQPQLWFSWHLSNWNPASDTLLTYLRVIERRLSQAS